MITKEMLDKLNEIQDELSHLPHGYISKKTINGKTQHYLQWTELGKKKSKYINSSSLSNIEASLERRKVLLLKEREIKNYLTKEDFLRIKENITYNTTVLYGEDLAKFYRNALDYKKRYCYQELDDYLHSKTDKIFILYGLRRTGKTTLIKQAISNMNNTEFESTAFIQINKDDTLSLLNKDLKKLMNNGYKYVFIDEITLLSDFIEGAALLSDIFASCGMKIILSGTDSLGFIFSKSNSLYDRAILLHTTFISYKEFEEVLGIKGIDNYIKYGGTMSVSGINYNSIFNNIDDTKEYINSSIAHNIQHSLKYYQNETHFRSLKELYDNDELTSAINRVIEDMNHEFTIDVLTKDFKSHDLGISRNNLRHDRFNPTDILDDIDIVKFTERLKNYLDIKNKNEQKVNIKSEHTIEIKEYLKLLDLIVDIDIKSISTNKTTKRTVFTQPGLRYSQAEYLISSLIEDDTFSDLSEEFKTGVINRILSEIKGRMVEDIILLETSLKTKNKQVFKLQFDVGEYDMVIRDIDNNTCEIYEIKYSNINTPEQYRFLIDKEKQDKTEFKYGKVIKRCVLYRGKSLKDNNIEYINIEKYLKRL